MREVEDCRQLKCSSVRLIPPQSHKSPQSPSAACRIACHNPRRAECRSDWSWRDKTSSRVKDGFAHVTVHTNTGETLTRCGLWAGCWCWHQSDEWWRAWALQHLQSKHKCHTTPPSADALRRSINTTMGVQYKPSLAVTSLKIRIKTWVGNWSYLVKPWSLAVELWRSRWRTAAVGPSFPRQKTPRPSRTTWQCCCLACSASAWYSPSSQRCRSFPSHIQSAGGRWRWMQFSPDTFLKPINN